MAAGLRLGSQESGLGGGSLLIVGTSYYSRGVLPFKKIMLGMYFEFSCFGGCNECLRSEAPEK